MDLSSLPGHAAGPAGTVAPGHGRRHLVKAPARLRYESWHLLHLYAYLGAGLALPHQLWTGQDFLGRPAATVFWWGLYAVVLAAVLVFRVGLPLWPLAAAPAAGHRVVPRSPT